MRYKVLFRLLLCSFSVLLVLMLLFYTTPLPNSQKNGFKRIILPGKLRKVYEKAIYMDITSFSGMSHDWYYLNGQDPGWLISISKTLTVVDTFFFGLRQTDKFLAPNTYVDSPRVYMYAGNISYLIKGNLHQFNVDTLRLQTPIFLRSAQISPQLLAIRAYDESQTNQVFKLVNCNSGAIIKETSLGLKDNELGFSTDGTLHYDNVKKKVVFIQRYVNKFYCLDTSLNLINIGQTIDTISKVDFKTNIETFNNESKVTSSSARKELNFTTSVSNGYLYVASKYKADNEQYSDFNNNFPFDIYKIEDGQYVGSFYLPRTGEKKITSFIIDNQKLVVLYSNSTIISYQTPNFFNN